MRQALKFHLIGVGGVDSAQTALGKIRAGADLVQFYSAMVFHGPGLARTIKDGLAAEARKAGVARIGELVGRDAMAVARGEDF